MPPLVGDTTPWQPSEDLKSFEFSGEPTTSWIRYTHTVPSSDAWRKGLETAQPQYLRVEDFNAYNEGTSNFQKGFDFYSPRWVGDLGVECEVELAGNEGEIVLELVEGGVQFRCRFDVATGEAELSHAADAGFRPKATTSVKGPGVYRLALANVDDELFLWIDGKLIAFDAPTTYGPLENSRPTELDRAPAGIGARDIKARVSHLRVVRDIYYIAAKSQGGDNSQGEEFPLVADQFFVLGDNSAQSLDARFWRDERDGTSVNYVARELMIGKALMIYWPHGWYEISGTGIPFYIPIVDAPMYPNFARMGYVR